MFCGTRAFCKKDIPKGTVIGEYDGFTVTAESIFDDPDIDLTYVVWDDMPDNAPPSQRKGRTGQNILKFANHGWKHNPPNLDHNGYVFFAMRDIEEGEELLWTYGPFEYDG